MLRSPLNRLLVNSRTVLTMANHLATQNAPPTVLHDPKNSKFYMKLNGNDEAVLEYVNRKGTLDMYHTEVPDAYRGQGLAAMLAKAAFDHAVENHLPMKLSCSYLQKYFKENPKDEYKKLVV